MEPVSPVTESSNPITADIDLASPQGIVKLLSQCDSEIFSGWRLYKSLYDVEIRAAVDDVAKIASSVITTEGGLIVLSGCGTSGRLAFIATRTFNRILLKILDCPNKFCYTIAGGDRALLLSTEAPEDSWTAGVEDLERVTSGASRVLFVGITCGLSAPYVAGQLNHCLNHSNKFTSVLIGFNPVELARRSAITGWSKTFHDVASEMESKSKDKLCFIINPVVGPEQITGSSRMKSGSATKILLETIFYTAINKSLNKHLPDCSTLIEKMFQSYEFALRQTYLRSPSILSFVKQAGNSLCTGGRVCYIGKDSVGIMAVIDASECPPTYGASYNDIRGFLEGGWITLGNIEGDLSSRGIEYQLDKNYFKDFILPSLGEFDTVFFVADNFQAISDGEFLLKELQAKKCFVGVVSASKPSDISDDRTVVLDIPVEVVSVLLSSMNSKLTPFIATSLLEISTKWVLNAISTGAHIMKGKVLGNKMIDLQVSNSKLYHRAIGIIQNFSDVNSSTAEEKLLMSIYGSDTGEHVGGRGAGIPAHIQHATRQEMVVPRAILMARSGCTYTEANDQLKANPIVRKVLNQP